MYVIGITAHEIILNECISQGIDYGEMYDIIRELLIKYNAGKAFAKRMGIKWLNNVSKKIPYRTQFIDIVAHPENYSKKARRVFAWKVACEIWYSEKSVLVLEQMKAFVEEGEALASIIDSVYMKGENTKNSDEAMQKELFMGRTKYFDVKKDAIVLYGLLIWKYCKRRDREDKDNGIIDKNGNRIN
ncbi:hypothetical protein [Butyrivibrio sp. JL13D10]|uniref:hypothetical protein n=1 Tax=Butyrivibrio sp. JL13D10 TaxID=3236815 RepID=UPI0038B586AC